MVAKRVQVTGETHALVEVAVVVDPSWRPARPETATLRQAIYSLLLQAWGSEAEAAVIAHRVPPDLPVSTVSPKDLHVVVAAVMADADFIVTSNWDAFPTVPAPPRPRRIQPYPFLERLRSE